MRSKTRSTDSAYLGLALGHERHTVQLEGKHSSVERTLGVEDVRIEATSVGCGRPPATRHISKPERWIRCKLLVGGTACDETIRHHGRNGFDYPDWACW